MGNLSIFIALNIVVQSQQVAVPAAHQKDAQTSILKQSPNDIKSLAKAVHENQRNEIAMKISCGPYKYYASTEMCEDCYGLCKTQGNRNMCSVVCLIVYIELYSLKELKHRLTTVERSEKASSPVIMVSFALAVICVSIFLVFGLCFFVKMLCSRCRSHNDKSDIETTSAHSNSAKGPDVGHEETPLVKSDQDQLKQTASRPLIGQCRQEDSATNNAETATPEGSTQGRTTLEGATPGRGLSFITSPVQDDSQTTMYKTELGS